MDRWSNWTSKYITLPPLLCISNSRDISWRLLGVKSKILWPYGNVPSRTCLRKHYLHIIWQGHFLTVSGFSKIRWPYGNVPVGFALESLNSIWFGKDICWRSVDFRISAPETVRKCPFSNFKSWCHDLVQRISESRVNAVRLHQGRDKGGDGCGVLVGPSHFLKSWLCGTFNPQK